MNLLLFTCMLLSIFGITHGFDRKLESKLNPGCHTCNNENITLLYIKSIGNADVIHNIWDFTSGTPTIIFAMTDLNTTLNVIWQNESLKNIFLTQQPKYSFGILLNKIWEFDDVNDTASFDPDTMKGIPFNTKDIFWEQKGIIQDDEEVMVRVVTHSMSHKKNKRTGDIIIKLDMFPFSSYAFDLPHLIHSANSSLIDIVIENMTTSSDFNKSRFALELVFISTEKSKGLIRMTTRKGLDDEHTPGVFEILEFVTPETLENGDGGFVQYRPVSYTKPHRDVASSTKVSTGELTSATIPKNTTADYFFKNIEDFQILCEKVIITLGGKGDGFYNKTHYNIWSFTSGYGKPPIESFSLLVILIISIGLGVPFLLITFGGIYVCVKRRRDRMNEHNILVED